MTNLMVSAGFQNIGEAHDICVNVSSGIFQRVPDAGLSSQIDDRIKTVFREDLIQRRSVFEAAFTEPETRMLDQLSQPSCFSFTL